MVKEIRLALDCGFNVDVVCFEFKNWSYANNLKIIKDLKQVNFKIIPANRKPILPWLKSVVLEKMLKAYAGLFEINGFYLSQAASRRTVLLLNSIKSLENKYDWVIGHNYGAMYPAAFAAQKFNCKSGFDMEDYHPGEGHNVKEQQLIKKLILEQLPKFNYVSFASPLIKEQVKVDFGKELSGWIILLNYFTKNEFIKPNPLHNEVLNLVWFSQNINYGRGLEQIIPAIETKYPRIKLTLIGNKHEDFFNKYIQGKKSVTTLPPMEQSELHKALNNFDAGLAIEPGKDQNNLLAIGNKLLAYCQAGLFIIATDTPAHVNFFADKPGIAKITSLNKENIKETIEELLKKSECIQLSKQQRFTNFELHCWETESVKLKEVWEDVVL
ncbi:MAG TPA: hypothetical protein PK987_06130 [Ferruginibacter sp.]|nr:hypothetical protein [Ferruginibacter sp.]